jgi:hypothetical protein
MTDNSRQSGAAVEARYQFMDPATNPPGLDEAHLYTRFGLTKADEHVVAR